MATAAQTVAGTSAEVVAGIEIAGEGHVTGILAHGLGPTQTPAWAAETLAGLTLAGPAGADYDRALFPHWKDAAAAAWGWAAGWEDCDARDATLIRDGTDVQVDAHCEAVRGVWKDPYSGSVLTDPSGIDIDHVVPLAAAWRAGAWDWPSAQRARYANDPLVLVASAAGQNRAKGDAGPQGWQPPAAGAHCAYAVRWIAVKDSYGLGLEDERERAALEDMLATCKNVKKLAERQISPPPATAPVEPNPAPATTKAGANRKATAAPSGTASGGEGSGDAGSDDAGTPSAPASQARPDAAGGCPDAAPIKGNANSMIYHTPGSRSYARTKAEACFATTEAAEAAGYRAPRG
jgi:hypothetical protein